MQTSQPPSERIGILGGTFNPPHVGHLALARAAAGELGLDRVLLTPALVPPHKPVEDDPGAEHRLRMCRVAIGDDPRLGVCTLELERDPPSYTVDTLRAIDGDRPRADMTLIVGADMACTLASWREPQEILRLARLAVAEREGISREEVLRVLESIGDASLTVFLEMPRVDVSSSVVRERAAAGEQVEPLVGPGVASYIAEHRLYAPGAQTEVAQVTS